MNDGGKLKKREKDTHRQDGVLFLCLGRDAVTTPRVVFGKALLRRAGGWRNSPTSGKDIPFHCLRIYPIPAPVYSSFTIYVLVPVYQIINDACWYIPNMYGPSCGMDSDLL